MANTFNPKYSSRYNAINEVTVPMKNERVRMQHTDFVPKNVKIEKRSVLQSSYEKRIEREKLRTYNG